MDRDELSIGLLRDKLREFGNVDYTLDHEITEEYVEELKGDILSINEGIARREEKISFYQKCFGLYQKFRFLNFLYYLAPFAFIFGVIGIFLAHRGAVLLLLPGFALGKYLLGQFFLFQVNKKKKRILELSKEKEGLLKETEKRKDQREALLARAGILAAEIRYLEHCLKANED